MPVVNIKSNSEEKIVFEDAYTNVSLPPSFVDQNIESLTVNRLSGRGVSTNGKYVLFGGGSYSNTYYDKVDAYDTSLTKTKAPVLNSVKTSLAGANNSNYALFGGGLKDTSSNDITQTVDAYDTSLTKTETSLITKKMRLSGGNIGDYALFGGGSSASTFSQGSYTYTYSPTVCAFDTSLTRRSATNLSNAGNLADIASNSNYLIFSHPREGGSSQLALDVYDTSLTKTTVAYKSSVYTAVSNRNYVLLISSSGNTVHAYDTSLTYSNPERVFMNPAYNTNSCVSSNEYAIFAPRNLDNMFGTIYDSSLTRRALENNPNSSDLPRLGSVNDRYAIFYGTVGSDTAAVYAYDLNTRYDLDVQIPAFSKYKFTESSEQETTVEPVIKNYKQINTTFTGYIKPNANNYFTGQIATE